jgi:membrane protein
MKPRVLWELLQEAGNEWLEDKAPRLGAALAYYTIFALAPLLLIVIAVAGFVFGEDAARGELFEQIRGLVGDRGAAAIEAMVANANQKEANTLATIVGVAMLLVGAAGLFGQLQDALNTVWEVQPKPGRGLWGFLRDRFLSFTMVLGCAFLLLVSLVVSAVLAALGSLFGDWQASVVGQLINIAVSFGVITGLFAMIYRFLPDVQLAWKDVWLGAAITALLFTVGKWLIGLYLGHSSIGSAYGAAGSLAVLLVWLYYSAQIFLFGAELTKAYADKHGSRIVPLPNAEPVTEKARARQRIPHPPGKELAPH